MRIIGYERVNTYCTNTIRLTEAADIVQKNVALDACHVAVPHKREWEELKEDEAFTEEFRAVSYYINDEWEGVQQHSRPYATLPITLKNDKSYPVTFLIDSGAPNWYLSRHLIQALSELYEEAGKFKSVLYVDAVCKGEKIRLRDPQSHQAMTNVNVMSYNFALRHGILEDHCKWARTSELKQSESADPNLEESSEFKSATTRFKQAYKT